MKWTRCGMNRSWMTSFGICRIEVKSKITKKPICIDIMTCRAVAMQRPRDGRIYQGRLWVTTHKHVPTVTDTNATMEKLCFLCGPRRYVISKGHG
jgi:hypothetical protein